MRRTRHLPSTRGRSARRLMTAIALALAMPAALPAATYYIDAAGGSDANSGTTKASPWRHAPGMVGCTGVCGATAITPGDRIVFKGGVVWTAGNFPFVMSASGSDDANRVSYGVDQSWFSGSSWTRPVFDGEFTTPGDGAYNSLVVFGGSTRWVTFDGIEVRNMTVRNPDRSSALDHCLIQFAYGATDITVSNALVHSMKVTSTCSSQFGMVYGIGPMTNTVLEHSIVYNDDPVGKLYTGCTFNIDVVRFNVLHDGIQGVFGSRVVDDNLIYDILDCPDPDEHENGLETSSANAQVFNNVLHDVATGTALYVVGQGGGAAGTINVYNNIVYGTATTVASIQLDTDGTSAASTDIDIFNNTLVPGFSSAIGTTARGGSAWGTITVRNNHYITDSNLYDWAGGSGARTISDNVASSVADAASQGYAADRSYAPTASSAATVAAGANLGALGSAIGAALLSDTSAGGTRVPLRHPATGAWDAGAYQFAGGGGADGTAPSIPTDLAAVAVSPSRIDLAWSASTDDVGVTGYAILRDGSRIGAATTNSYADSGLTASTFYSYAVAAYDAAGNLSARSVATTVATPAAAVTVDAVAAKDTAADVTVLRGPRFSTTSPNELILAFVAADPGSGSAPVAAVAGAGLTWRLVKAASAQPGTAEVWQAFSPAPLTGVSVRATFARAVHGSITVVSFAGADPAAPVGASAAKSAASGAPGVALTTTRAGSSTYAVGNDWDTATARTPDPGQELVHQGLTKTGDTFWVQRSTAVAGAAGATLRLGDAAPTGDSFNMVAVEILPAAAASPAAPSGDG